LDPPNGEDYSNDEEYLRILAEDTWNCIAYYVDDETGLPYDNSEDKVTTGIDKIGFYIASLAVAKELGFISEKEATERLEKVLSTLTSEEFMVWNGSGVNESDNIKIPYAWYDITTLKTTNYDVATMDLGNYYACLIIGRNAFKNYSNDFDNLINNIHWSLFFNNTTFYSTYNVKEREFKGEVKYLAADTLTASLLAIAADECVPPEHWATLERNTMEWYGYVYYKPGWEGGGQFMHFLPGIFMDYRNMSMGGPIPMLESAKNFTKAQIRYADEIGAPVWGWSSSSGVPVDISGTDAILFSVKCGEGTRNTLQFKLKDDEGNEYGHRYLYTNLKDDWRQVRINYSELECYESSPSVSDGSLNLENIIYIAFAVESGCRDVTTNEKVVVGYGGEGNISICDIKFLNSTSGDTVDVSRFYGDWNTFKDAEYSFTPKNKINIKYRLRDNTFSQSQCLNNENEQNQDDWVEINKNYGYFGWGTLQDQIVTPHASVLALPYFKGEPTEKEIIQNLKLLEVYFSCRGPLGFKDAVDWKNKKVSERYLTLDQAMVLLSIANYLNGTAWNLFMQDDIFKNGIRLIVDDDSLCRIEAEDWVEQYGGCFDAQPNASGGLCLGDRWGDGNDEYAKYLINFEENIPDAKFKMNYSDKMGGNNKENRIIIFLDGDQKGELRTVNTKDWNIFTSSTEIGIGEIRAGEHVLEIRSNSTEDLNCVNIDYFVFYM